MVHKNSNEIRQHGDGYEMNHRDEPSIERLPDEHVSIVETIDDREIARPVGTTRRKLYFNPAYFEPHLMHVSSSPSFTKGHFKFKHLNCIHK